MTITFLDRDGQALDDGRVEQLANWERISLRTGCFCNPGRPPWRRSDAGDHADILPPRPSALGPGDASRDPRRCGRDVTAVRVSVGLASNFADVDTFIRFAAGFLDATTAEIGNVEAGGPLCSTERDAAM